jgi:hypothetical protein
LGDHAVLLRAETDCFDSRSKNSIGLSTKKLKKNKRGGYYDLGSPNYYQEHWLQMVLSGTSQLIVGTWKEDAHSAEVALIDQLHHFTIDNLADKGQLPRARQQEVFESLASMLSWIKGCFSKAVAAQLSPEDKLSQGRITFSKAGGQKTLTFALLLEAQHADFLPEVFVTALAEL